MKKVMIAAMVLALMAGSSMAAVPSVVGGIRDGLAAGFFMDQGVAKNVALRGGLEFNTGNQPIILAFGGKFHLTYIGRSVPLALGAGFVGYFGNNHSDAGFSLTFIFGNLFDVQPMFFEVGVDAAGPGKLVAQLGYKIY